MKQLPKLFSPIGFVLGRGNSAMSGASIFNSSMIVRNAHTLHSKPPKITHLEPTIISPKTYGHFQKIIVGSKEVKSALKNPHLYNEATFPLPKTILSFLAEEFQEFLKRHDGKFLTALNNFGDEEEKLFYYELPRLKPAISDIPPISNTRDEEQPVLQRNFMQLSFLSIIMKILNLESVTDVIAVSSTYEGSNGNGNFHSDRLFEEKFEERIVVSTSALQSDNKTPTFFLDNEQLAADIATMNPKYLEILAGKFKLSPGDSRNFRIYDPTKKSFTFHTNTNIDRDELEVNDLESSDHSEAIKALLLAINMGALRLCLKNNQTVVHHDLLHAAGSSISPQPFANNQLEIAIPDYLNQYSEGNEDISLKRIVGVNSFKKIPAKTVTATKNLPLNDKQTTPEKT